MFLEFILLCSLKMMIRSIEFLQNDPISEKIEKNNDSTNILL